MRICLKLIFSFFLSQYFKLIFSFFIKRKSGCYVVIDIDNTIADTWKVLKRLRKSKYYMLIPTLNGTIREIEKKYVGIPRIFLSNRNALTYSVTRNWLLKNQLIDFERDLLILTSYPEQKLYYLKMLANKSAQVYYYDDLSFNHENGEVKYYSNIISEVRNLNINYYDYSYILSLNLND